MMLRSRVRQAAAQACAPHKGGSCGTGQGAQMRLGAGAALPGPRFRAQTRARGRARDAGQEHRCACALAGLRRTPSLRCPAPLSCWSVSAKGRRGPHRQRASPPKHCTVSQTGYFSFAPLSQVECFPESAQVHAVHTVWLQEHEAREVLQGSALCFDWF